MRNQRCLAFIARPYRTICEHHTENVIINCRDHRRRIEYRSELTMFSRSFHKSKQRVRSVMHQRVSAHMHDIPLFWIHRIERIGTAVRFCAPRRNERPFSIRVGQRHAKSRIVHGIPLADMLNFLIFQRLQNLRSPRPRTNHTSMRRLNAHAAHGIQRVEAGTNLRLHIAGEHIFTRTRHRVHIHGQIDNNLPKRNNFSSHCDAFRTSVIVSLTTVPADQTILTSLSALSSRNARSDVTVPTKSR